MHVLEAFRDRVWAEDPSRSNWSLRTLRFGRGKVASLLQILHFKLDECVQRSSQINGERPGQTSWTWSLLHLVNLNYVAHSGFARLIECTLLVIRLAKSNCRDWWFQLPNWGLCCLFSEYVKDFIQVRTWQVPLDSLKRAGAQLRMQQELVPFFWDEEFVQSVQMPLSFMMLQSCPKPRPKRSLNHLRGGRTERQLLKSEVIRAWPPFVVWGLSCKMVNGNIKR